MRYRDPIFSAVTVTSNVTYGSAVNLENQTITLQLDMYQPAGDTVTARPAIVWVHGGSFCCGSRTSPELVDEANTFAKQGYVNISIDYRLESPGCSGTFSNCVAAIQEAAADAQTAVRFLRTKSATYGIDPNRIAIGGSSAGGITALNVGYSTPEDPSAGVRAAVSLSGRVDLRREALDESCLADPRFSSDHDEVPMTRLGCVPVAGQLVELLITTDESLVARHGVGVAVSRKAARCHPMMPFPPRIEAAGRCLPFRRSVWPL